MPSGVILPGTTPCFSSGVQCCTSMPCKGSQCNHNHGLLVQMPSSQCARYQPQERRCNIQDYGGELVVMWTEGVCLAGVGAAIRVAGRPARQQRLQRPSHKAGRHGPGHAAAHEAGGAAGESSPRAPARTCIWRMHADGWPRPRLPAC